MIKNKKFIISIIILGLINFLFILLIFQTLKDIKENSLALISQKKELKVLENKIKDLKEFEKEFEINKENLEKINQLFLRRDDPREFINLRTFLEKTAEEAEVEINISLFTPESQGEPWPFFSFQVFCQGKFLNVMRFLEKLENSPYLIEISHLFIRKIEREEMEASFSFKIFSR